MVVSLSERCARGGACDSLPQDACRRRACCLRGQDSQRRQARRFAGGATEEVRVGHQSQDRQGAGADDSAVGARAGGSRHRVMDRRAFVAIIGGSVLAGSRAGEAQQAGKVWRIGFLSPYSADFDKTWRAAFKLGLLDIGYVEGKNLVIDERHGKGPADRLTEVAAELVRMK